MNDNEPVSQLIIQTFYILFITLFIDVNLLHLTTNAQLRRECHSTYYILYDGEMKLNTHVEAKTIYPCHHNHLTFNTTTVIVTIDVVFFIFSLHH